MNKIVSQIKFGWRLFASRNLSMRMFLPLLLLGFVCHIFLAPLRSFAEAVQHPAAPFVFPLLLSDVYFLTLFMAFAVYYFSDAPFMKNWTMYQVIRTGRVRWALGQIQAIVMSAFLFVTAAACLAGLLLLPYITLREGWGKVLYTLSVKGMSGDFSVPYGIIGQYTVLEAMGITILTGGLVLSFLGLLMFCISLSGFRLCANITAMAFVILPVVQLNIGTDVPALVWLSPVSWMNLAGGNGGGSGPPPGYCTAALGGLCVLLGAAVIWKIRTVDFQMVKED